MDESLAGSTRSQERERLQLLLDDLENVRRNDRGQRRTQYERILAGTRTALQKVPLVHGLSRTGDLPCVIEECRLRTRESRTPHATPMNAEQTLDFPPSVYTAAGVMYPGRQAALVFAATIEVGSPVQASPWDSGHFCNTQRGKLQNASAAMRKKLFERNTLPSPEYREYLVDYVASCFSAAADYIDNKPHCYADPLGVLDKKYAVSRIFEVRFQDDVTFDLGHLLAVFLPSYRRRNVSGDLSVALDALRDADVTVRYYNASEQGLRHQVRNWIRNHLQIT